MENLKEKLKMLKHITPDEEYVLRSRREILSMQTTSSVFRSWKVFVRMLESAAAIGFAGLLILLAIGGVSLWNRSPSLAGLDPSALRAEAQAIDFQIQLTGLDYERLAVPEQESTLSGVVEDISRSLLEDEQDSEEPQQPVASSTASADDATLDEALDLLSQ